MPPPGHGPPPPGPQGPPAPHVNPAFFQQQAGPPPHQPHPQTGPPPQGPPHGPPGHGPPHGYGPPATTRVSQYTLTSITTTIYFKQFYVSFFNFDKLISCLICIFNYCFLLYYFEIK